MDRLKSAASSGMDKAKNMKKPSFGGGGSASGSSASASSPAGSSITGLGLRNKVRAPVNNLLGRDGGTVERPPVRPRTELKDPASFPPPPKHRALSGSPVSADVNDSSGNQSQRQVPAPPGRLDVSAKKPPPVPPRVPPRQETFPQPKPVSDEDVRANGGLNTAAALGRLGASGVSVPGFGIGTSPAPSSSTPSPPPPPRPGIASLSNKFGKLSTTTGSQSLPTEGTSFAEKQAAAKTANNFYKNPGSVSFKDGLAAAKTAHNFQQRHGDQVAAGLKAAQSANDKYGSGETLARPVPSPPPRAALAAHTPSPPLPARNGAHPSPPLPARNGALPSPPLPPRTPSTHLENGIAKKKPPPPPPISKKTDPPAADSRPSLPPPIPRATRPSAPSPSASAPSSPSLYASTALPNAGLPASMVSELPQDLDLSLSTSWFASNPPQLPHSISSVSDKMLAMTTSWVRTPSGRTKHTLVFAVRWTLNLSTTKIKITWDASHPTGTVNAAQRHFPPPTPHSLPELEAAALKYGAAVAAWCHSQLGRQVGNGECWTLAHDALAATPGAFVSQTYTHGACIFAWCPPHEPARSVTRLMPGDILQFWKAKFEVCDDATGRVVGWGSAGDPDHTAVVVDATNNNVVKVLEQNVGGKKQVQFGQYKLQAEMREGRVRVFRPVGESYASFDAEWVE